MQQLIAPTGILYLIPNLLGGEDTHILPPYILTTLQHTDIFIVEGIRNARRYLVKAGIKTIGKQIDDLIFCEWQKNTSPADIRKWLQPLAQGKNIGVISEAGCPAVADPGADIVAIAHQMGYPVMPLVGPSSILLALMGSGFNGQSFAFTGYVPLASPALESHIKHLEKLACQQRQTQIFMDTPYRNNNLLETILKVCQPQTRLCIAASLTLPEQYLCTKTIAEWKKQNLPNLHKQPALFLLQ